jgi:hypothetical protein
MVFGFGGNLSLLICINNAKFGHNQESQHWRGFGETSRRFRRPTPFKNLYEILRRG